jgi:hypothetical protein
MLEAHWTTAGYAAPNSAVYPWQWLWDSCFHAVIWHALGRTDRAVSELTQALSAQTREGFVPHMNYQLDPRASEAFWGRRGASSITQPPMYGHAVAGLLDDDVDVPDALVASAVRGLRFLIDHRARERSGLVRLCHPWESGADDSPRWDDLCPGGWAPDRWWAAKGELLSSVVVDGDGAAVDNPAFPVASVGFNALLAWNARRLGASTGDPALLEAADELAEAIDRRWDGSRGTWVDAGPTAEGSGHCRTADALLPLLVTTNATAVDAVCAQLVDPAAFGGRYGPAGVHRAEPVYAERTYWRGPVWPQLAYLLWLGLLAAGRTIEATDLASRTVAGGVRSGLAEYWTADDGLGLGAIPQSWTGLVVIMAS